MGQCMSKTGAFMSPEVKVMSCTVKSVGLSGVTLNVQLMAHNPNPATLPATRIIYTLKKASDNTVLTDGVDRQKFELRASGASRVTVPMTFKYWGLGAAGKSLVARGKTSIVVSGEIDFEAPMAPGGKATCKFEDTVEVAMEDMMGG